MVTPIGPTPAPAAAPATPVRAPAVTPATPATPTTIPVTGPITLAVSGAVNITLVPAVPLAPAPVPVTTTTTTTTTTTGPSAAPAAGPRTPAAHATPAHNINWTKLGIAAAVAATIGGVAYCEYERDQANKVETSNFRAAGLRRKGIEEGVEALKPTISVKVRAQRVGDTAEVSLKNSELVVDDCKETHPATISVVETEMAGNGVIKATVNIVITAHGNQKYTYEGTVMAGRVAEDVLVNADLQ